MATISRPNVRRFDLVQANRQVRDPLFRLRGIIKQYVILQSLAALAICLAIWFWAGLLLDYGSFQLLTFDWVQDLPRGFRALLTGSAIFAVWFFVEFRNVLGRHPRRDKKLTWEDKLTANKPLLWGLTVGFGVAWLVVWTVGVWFVTDPLLVGGAVAFLLAAFAVAVVLKRLMYEFSDPSLALLLERRFPKELGDRLITAVELSNPKEAAKYGYSEEMIEETIREAAHRVGKLPVRDVFDWSRLYKQGIWAVVLTIGGLILSPLAIEGLDVSGQAIKGQPVVFQPSLTDVQDVSEIWFERNILLLNTIWPRHAMLELIDFPESGEIKIGRGDPPPSIRVRALKYVVADSNPAYPEGWRALRMEDLDEKLFGKPVPHIELLNEWRLNGTWRQMTVDQVDLKFEQELRQVLNARQKARGDAQVALDGVNKQNRDLSQNATDAERNALQEQIKALEEAVAALEKEIAKLQAVPNFLSDLSDRCDDPSMKRTMRRLVIPETVVVKFSGSEDDGYFNLTRQKDNEYLGQFPELKGNVRFTVRAEDYFSATRKVTLVPPPSFETVIREEAHPAYLYYYGSPEFLRGKKQLMPPVEFSARNVSVISFAVPLGSDVTLVAETNKDLKPLSGEEKDRGLVVQGKPGTTMPAQMVVPVELLEPRKVKMTFPNVRTKLELIVRMVDTDGVVGTKELIIEPTEDTTPEVEVKPEVVRTVNNQYMITPSAIIPFVGRITDYNGGLDELPDDKSGDRTRPRGLEYVYQITPVESAREEQLRAIRAAGLLALPMASPNIDLATHLYRDRLPPLVTRKVKTLEGRTQVSKFQKALEARRREHLQPQVLSWLGERRLPDVDRRPIAQFLLEPDDYIRDRSRPVNSLTPDGIFGFDVESVEEDPGPGKEKVRLRAEDNEVQQRYRMQAWVESLDTNIESGRDSLTRRNRGVSKQKYNFLIVSETELLVEIGREEQRIFDDFKRVLDELVKIRSVTNQAVSDLTVSKEINENFLSSKILEVMELEENLEKQLGVTNKVYDDYERILNEMRVNRIRTPGIINKVDKEMVTPLEFIRKFLWVAAKEGYASYHKALEDSSASPADRASASRVKAEEAQLRLQGLIDACNAVLEQMRGIQGINELIKILRAMEEKEQMSLEKISQQKKWLLEQIEKSVN